MIKLFKPLSPYQLQIIVNKIRKDASLLVCHEINMRGIHYRKIYDLLWLGTPIKKRDEFIFPVTEDTFGDNIHLLGLADEGYTYKAFREFKINGWSIARRTRGFASLAFFQPIELQDKHIREKNDYIYPLTPKEMEEAANILCNDQKSLIILDMNWELINLSLLNNKINRTIIPSIKKMHTAGKIKCEFHVIDVVIKTYEKHGWEISEDDHMRYFLDKRGIKKFVQVC